MIPMANMELLPPTFWYIAWSLWAVVGAALWGSCVYYTITLIRELLKKEHGDTHE